jgi:hypothetical protein
MSCSETGIVVMHTSRVMLHYRILSARFSLSSHRRFPVVSRHRFFELWLLPTNDFRQSRRFRKFFAVPC